MECAMIDALLGHALRARMMVFIAAIAVLAFG